MVETYILYGKNIETPKNRTSKLNNLAMLKKLGVIFSTTSTKRPKHFQSKAKFIVFEGEDWAVKLLKIVEPIQESRSFRLGNHQCWTPRIATGAPRDKTDLPGVQRCSGSLKINQVRIDQLDLAEGRTKISYRHSCTVKGGKSKNVPRPMRLFSLSQCCRKIQRLKHVAQEMKEAILAQQMGQILFKKETNKT
ncbi:hypothetical protein PoB_004437000 [Plakobranchus ocellatus]|uniref:Uncharacterized protein n=1 Tax=Plakobranchus ocellatus TaxID=259542 RepID=A0AAV4BFI5_9GAST|nr:hypothetical protein PoB_004437000 [Plakobranchus ocellatus]